MPAGPSSRCSRFVKKRYREEINASKPHYDLQSMLTRLEKAASAFAVTSAWRGVTARTISVEVMENLMDKAKKKFEHEKKEWESITVSSTKPVGVVAPLRKMITHVASKLNKVHSQSSRSINPSQDQRRTLNPLNEPTVPMQQESVTAPVQEAGDIIVEVLSESESEDFNDVQSDDAIQFVEGSSRNSRLTDRVGHGIMMANGFSFRRERALFKKPGYSSYRCVWRECPARAHINETTIMGTVLKGHSHHPDFTDQQVRTTRDSLEMKARETALQTGNATANRDAVHLARTQLSDEQLSATSSKQAYVRSFQRARKREREELGDNYANINDPFDFTIPIRFHTARNLNNEEEPFFLKDINENGLRAVIFMSPTAKDIMEKSREIAFDGTFSIVPSHMYQLYTVHAFIEKSSIPIAYCITNKKTAELYRLLFTSIDCELRDNRRPISSMCDFERSAIMAAKEVWPDIEIGLCHFHFCQSIFRRIQKNSNLLARYNSTETARDRTIMKSLQCLAFVPPGEVYQVFCKLWDLSSEMDELFIYFFQTYIGHGQVPDNEIPDLQPGRKADVYIREHVQGRRGVTYPPQEWNVYDKTINGKVRTNNALECWHGIVNKYFHGSPTMTTLLTRIKEEHEFAMHAFREYRLNPERGLRQRRQKFKYRKHDQTLISIVMRYSSDYKDDPIGYLSALSHNCQSLSTMTMTDDD